MRGTLPRGERRGVVGVGVADESAYLAHDAQPALDHLVDGGRGGDVLAPPLRLAVDGGFEGDRRLVEFRDEVGAQAALDEFRLQREDLIADGVNFTSALLNS